MTFFCGLFTGLIIAAGYVIYRNAKNFGFGF